MADEFGDDADFAAALEASTRAPNGQIAPSAASSKPSGATESRQNGAAGPKKTGVQQPKPQALAKRAGPSSIIVSPRQKGNPIIANIKSMPWEYGDIPADYVLGVTTCALFLSLKYHRLHPEYIYTRIRALQGKYNLRVLLCMVDIQNHEEAIKELSKTSLINNVTIILCWSAAEGGRYLELFKSYEFAAPTSIKAHQSTSYADKLVEFMTVPRSINKTDAISLVSQTGTIRRAVNLQPEEVAVVPGWGDKKVQRFCSTVREPFRIQRTAKRGLDREDTRGTPISRAPTLSRDVTRADGSPGPAQTAVGNPLPPSNSPSRPVSATEMPDADRRPPTRLAEEAPIGDVFADAEEAFAEAESSPAKKMPIQGKRKVPEEDLSDGIMAALSKLRKQG